MISPVLPAVLVVATAGALRRATASTRSKRVRRRLAAAPGPHGPRGAPPLRAPAWFAAALVDAGVAWSPDAAWSAWCAGVAGAVALATPTAGPGTAAVLALVAVVGPLVALRLVRGRGDRMAESALPHVLDAVAAALRSGASLRQAVAEAARVAPPALAADMAAVERAAAHGAALAGALDAWARRRPLPGVRLAAAALALAADTGGAQARAVDGVAATVRARLAVRDEVRALSSQARLSAVVIGVAPLGFAGLAVASDDATAAFLLGTPIGLGCLAAGLLLDAAAAAWMAHLAELEP